MSVIIQPKGWILWINLVTSIIFLVVHLRFVAVVFPPNVVHSKDSYWDTSSPLQRDSIATKGKERKSSSDEENEEQGVVVDNAASLIHDTGMLADVNITEDCRYWSQLFRNESMKNDLEGARRRVQAFAETPCGQLWFATAAPTASSSLPSPGTRIRVVVAFCASSLDWLEETLRSLVSTYGYVVCVQVYSKCAKERELMEASLFTTMTQFTATTVIHTVPNVGGCDHTYAQWLAHHEAHQDWDFVIFVKDTQALVEEQQRSFVDMLTTAASKGFGCGNDPPRPGKKIRLKGAVDDVADDGGYATLSVYHATSILKGFRAKWHDYERKTVKLQLLNNNTSRQTLPFESNYKQLRYYMGDILKSKSFPLWDKGNSTRSQRSLAQVCYGGVFAVQRERVRVVARKSNDADIWVRLAHSLTRANNIEEGHLVERLWAELFTAPLTNEEAEAIKEFADGSTMFQGTMYGTMARIL